MSDNSAPEIETKTCGSLLDRGEFERAPKALFPRIFAGKLVQDNPGSSYTLENLPAITQQGTSTDWGSPGSCEAQSFGYGVGSFTAARNLDGSIKWDASQPGNEASAAYLYAWALHRQNETCPDGTLATPYMAHLVVHGCPTVSDVSYQPLCSYIGKIDLNKSYPDAQRMRIGAYYTFEIDDPSISFEIKALIASNHIIAFSGEVLDHYTSPNIVKIFQDGIIYNGQPVSNTGHGQLLVGWDDTVGPSTNPGAFLVQNSFGTSWPPSDCKSIAPAGMAYWSYETFFASQQFAAIGLPYDPSPLNGPSLANQTGENIGTVTATQISVGPSFLIVQVQFDLPLLVNKITLIEPITGSTMQGSFDAYMNNGYLYFQRIDMKSFVLGDWAISIDAVNTIKNEAMTLTAQSVSVNSSGYVPAAPEELTADLTVYDTTGAKALVTVKNG